MYTVIYGINETTTLFLNSRFNKGSNIFACTKGGESYQGEPSLSLEQLVKMNRNEIDRVVICSEFVAEISANLINNGFTLEQLYFFDYHKKIPVPLTDISLSSVSKNNTLYAFYDLSFNLPCYDVTVFCVLAELKRKSLGLDHIHFVVVPTAVSKVDIWAQLLILAVWITNGELTKYSVVTLNAFHHVQVSQCFRCAKMHNL